MRRLGEPDRHDALAATALELDPSIDPSREQRATGAVMLAAELFGVDRPGGFGLEGVVFQAPPWSFIENESHFQ
jgi:hypothetical protein